MLQRLDGHQCLGLGQPQYHGVQPSVHGYAHQPHQTETTGQPARHAQSQIDGLMAPTHVAETTAELQRSCHGSCLTHALAYL